MKNWLTSVRKNIIKLFKVKDKVWTQKHNSKNVKDFNYQAGQPQHPDQTIPPQVRS